MGRVASARGRRLSGSSPMFSREPSPEAEWDRGGSAGPRAQFEVPDQPRDRLESGEVEAVADPLAELAAVAHSDARDAGGTRGDDAGGRILDRHGFPRLNRETLDG